MKSSNRPMALIWVVVILFFALIPTARACDSSEVERLLDRSVVQIEGASSGEFLRYTQEFNGAVKDLSKCLRYSGEKISSDLRGKIMERSALLIKMADDREK
jgi:hypothetical protein